MKYKEVDTPKNVPANDCVFCYFSSRKAAERWKEQQERGGIHEATICQWKVFGSKDI